MKRDTPPLDQDPTRWIDRPAGADAEGRAAERLRGALARELPAFAPGHLRELRRRPPLLLPVARLAAVAGAVLVLGVGLGVAGAASGWLGRRGPSAPAPREDRLEVAAGGAARLHRSGRWRVALAGPGTATVVDAEVGTVRLSAGTLTVAAEAAPMAIEAGGEQFRLEPGAAARIAVSPGGGAEAIALVGHVVATLGSTALATRVATESERALARSALGEAPAAPPAEPAPAPAAAPPEPPRAAARTPKPSETVAAAAVPTPETPPAEITQDLPQDVRQNLRPAPVAAPPLAGNADSEAAWLGRALTSLRRDGDPAAALAILERHAARFPASALTTEVATIRVEALLARGDDAAALATLEALPPSRGSLDRRLLASRGELRAQAGRCADAARDFSAVLRAPPADAVDECALRGRAACAALVHDEAGLRADLGLYLERFADRPFAAEARARLETRPAP